MAAGGERLKADIFDVLWFELPVADERFTRLTEFDRR